MVLFGSSIKGTGVACLIHNDTLYTFVRVELICLFLYLWIDYYELCFFFINWLPDLRATTKPIKSEPIKIQNLSNHIKSKPIHNKPYLTTKRTHQNKTNQNKKPIKLYQIKTYKKNIKPTLVVFGIVINFYF